jgi:hypothetical protein
MRRIAAQLFALLGASIVLASCGAAPKQTPSEQIRTSFARLLRAFVDHDARTACELLFPFGHSQSASALVADLKGLETPAGRTAYQNQVAHCVPTFAADPRNFTGYARVFSRVKLGRITIRGNIAIVQASNSNGQQAVTTFVRAAGEWRLLIGV